MVVEDIALEPQTPGIRQTLSVFRFGEAGARPKIYVQGALHADEIPGMIAAQRLVALLKMIDAAGGILGEVVVVPVANPIGLAQAVMGSSIGRFHLADGLNFNRGYPALAEGVALRIETELGLEEAENVAAIRKALLDEIADLDKPTHVHTLKHTLLGLAIDSDVVLDLHCDSEASVHLYTLTPHAERCEPLARYLGAEAVLLATESGDDPFDEAASRPWLDLQQRFPAYPIPLPCMAVTVELRGQRDVSAALADDDAAALMAFLTHAGAIAGEAPPLPPARCEPTPLAACEPLTAPHAGIVLYAREPGARIEPGDTVAEIVDPLSGAASAVTAKSAGILFARSARRFAKGGERLGKIAGTTLSRTGKLLSP